MSREVDTEIRQHPFFAELDPVDCARLAHCARSETWPAGAIIVREGDPANALYAFVEGRAVLTTPVPGHEPITLQTLDPGEVAGWSWLSDERWAFDLRALYACRALVFDGACLRALMESDPKLGYVLLQRILRVMTSRLVACRLRLVDLWRT
jgi:CRP-like cAMP-binding protein